MRIHKGARRPPFAGEPAQGKESAWDYPRPPRLMADSRPVEVRSGDRLIARSNKNYRICETASPPTFYIPPDQIDWNLLEPIEGGSYCEWITDEIVGPFKGEPGTGHW